MNKWTHTFIDNGTQSSFFRIGPCAWLYTAADGLMDTYDHVMLCDLSNSATNRMRYVIKDFLENILYARDEIDWN